MPDGTRLQTVFLDRDGTINRKAPEGSYITSPDDFQLLPGAARAIRELNRAGVLVIVVTNQRGVARGLMTETDLSDIHLRMRELLAAEGAYVDAIYSCTHEAGSCECRKPATGLIDQAMTDFPEIDSRSAAVVGDAESDVELGLRAGLLTLWLRPADAAPISSRPGVQHATDLAAAVSWLLSRTRPSPSGRVAQAG